MTSIIISRTLLRNFLCTPAPKSQNRAELHCQHQSEYHTCTN